MPTNPNALVTIGQDQKKALKVNDAIYLAIGFGNTFMVTTDAGNVVIDTSTVINAQRHKQLLQAENRGPIKYIVLTHGHGDHTGGIGVWRERNTQVVAQRLHTDFMNYQARLAGFFGRRNAAQFALRMPQSTAPWAGNYGGKIEPNIFLDEQYEFELGGVKFEVFHTPGETYDHATIWVPKYKAAFVGDNYYPSFPNIYTLRGTQPRWPLDYINSLNRVLALKPEIVLPSHGMPIHGNQEITRRLTRYRDAIQYVHDEVVKGMNAGKNVYTLMRDIKLPPELDIGEGYGKLTWSIRGIYEGYVGWFDLDPASMYEIPQDSVYNEVVKLAGGADAVNRLAIERLKRNELVEALHLTAMALEGEPKHRGSLETRLKALEALRERCKNSNERGWLDYSIREVRTALDQKQR